MTRQKKNQKFREIATLEGLDAEITHLHRSNEMREEDLKSRLAYMPEVYTPKAIAREGLHRAAHSVNFFGFALSVVTFLKGLLIKR